MWNEIKHDEKLESLKRWSESLLKLKVAENETYDLTNLAKSTGTEKSESTCTNLTQVCEIPVN